MLTPVFRCGGCTRRAAPLGLPTASSSSTAVSQSLVARCGGAQWTALCTTQREYTTLTRTSLFRRTFELRRTTPPSSSFATGGGASLSPAGAIFTSPSSSSAGAKSAVNGGCTPGRQAREARRAAGVAAASANPSHRPPLKGAVRGSGDGGTSRASRSTKRPPTRPTSASSCSSFSAGGKSAKRGEAKRTPDRSTTKTTPSSGSKKAAAGPSMRGRFNRVAASKGLGFAAYLYILGESLNLYLTYLLHCGHTPFGDVGTWLAAVGVDREKYLDVGPVVYGCRFSPRLVLNYLVVNTCMLPMYRVEFAFCEATAPALRKLCGPLQRMMQARRERQLSQIPRAPSAG